MDLCVTVPASSANLGPGFDILGLSLQLYNKFYARFPKDLDDEDFKKKFSVKLTGLAAETEPDENKLIESLSAPDNIFWKSYNSIFQKLSLEPVPIQVEVDLQIPVSRGLGSSSTAILAGLFIANETTRKFFDCSYSAQELIYFAIEIEGHADNISAAALGGCHLIIPSEPSHLVKLDWQLPVVFMTVVPHKTSSTVENRKSLADSISAADLKFQTSRVALLVSLLSKQSLNKEDIPYLSIAFQDSYHQPARAAQIPHFENTIKTWVDQGAVAGYLSGSGPTMICVCEKSKLLSPKAILGSFDLDDYPCSLRALEFDKTGIVLERL